MSRVLTRGPPVIVALVVLLGAVVLIGWLIESDPLKQVHPALPPMVPLTAASLIVAAGTLGALWAGPRWYPWARFTAAGVILSGAMMLLLYALENTVAAIPVSAAFAMASPTAVSLVLLGGSLLCASLTGRRARAVVPWLALVSLLPPLIALTGYAFLDRRLYGAGPHGGTALHTAMALSLLSLGTLALDPKWGFMGELTTSAAGGVMARRMLPATLLPLAIGALLVRLNRAGRLDSSLLGPLFGVMMMVAFAALIWRNAVKLNRLHAEQVKAERQAVAEAERQRALAADNALLCRTAEKAARDREQVLAIVSHDLKNPLSAIRLSTTLLASRLAGTPGERALSRQVGAIERAVAHMLTLIHQLLDAARLDAGQAIIVAPELAPLAPEVDEALSLIEPQATQKQLHLERRLETPLEAWFDRDRVLQVLANLLGNAVKFTPPGGRITVETRRVGDEAWVSVRDTGPGIPEPSRAHLFERHWQARETAGQGSGLGLYIARGLVESHGGRLWLDGEAGGGATFTFSLLTHPPAA